MLKNSPLRIFFKGRNNILVALWLITICCILSCNNDSPDKVIAGVKKTLADSLYTPPDTSAIPHDELGEMIRYGRELILNTAHYIGPQGIVSHSLGNKMVCGNCHLDAGTRPFGLNYFSSHARYPQYRGRENRILTLAERVNNCIERPHHGTPIPLDSKEMIAMVSYMKWLSSNVPTGQHVKGDELMELELPDVAADVQNGAHIYNVQCSRCHGADGAGQFRPDSSGYIYPPLWGKWSYDMGSSMHRVLKAAAFIKANMPYQLAYWNKPVLSDKEAIDVAAFINDDRLHDRPKRKMEEHYPDYPNERVRPIDHFKAPFPDTFSEMQHKLGPFRPIIEYHKAHGLPVIF